MSDPPTRVGQYVLHGLLGAGGMATVHLGRLEGVGGFARAVAIKRLHSYLASDRKLAARFLDEARLPTRIRHTNVVQTIDVVVEGDDYLVVMEYVPGETLSRLLQVACKAEDPPPVHIVSSIMSGVLHGLHAAHQAKTEQGKPLCIVHRDVSPQNIIVGPDGIARILDFGIAKAAGQSSLTTGDQIKGKLSYMAPEQLGARAPARIGSSSSAVTVRTDVFAAAIVLWEALVGRRLFLDESEARTLDNLLSMPIQPPSTFVTGLSFALDAVVLRGLERDPDKRFASARDMALALEQAAPPASPAEVGAWVQELAHEGLSIRAAMLQEVESAFASDPISLADGLSVDSSQSVAPFVRTAAGNKKRALVAAPVVLIGLCLGSIALALHARAGSASTPGNAGEVSAGDNAGVPPASSDDPPDPAASSSAPPRLAAPGPFLGPMRPTRTRQRPPRTTSSGARDAASSLHCAPPYTFDSVGHKVFKPECF